MKTRREGHQLALLFGPHCTVHPESVATAACRCCYREVCTLCAGHNGEIVPRRSTCARRRTERVRISVTLRALVATASASMVWWRSRRVPPAPTAVAPLADDSPESKELTRLRAELGREPCDRRRVIELAELALRAGDSRETLNTADTFFEKCGDYPGLRRLSYAAHQQLSEWPAAANDVSKLIESDPQNPNYRGWRGIVFEESGDLAHASGSH